MKIYEQSASSVTSSIKRKAIGGAIFACTIIVISGCVALYQEIEFSNSAKQTIVVDAAQAHLAGKIANYSLLCRRYEKDVFLNIKQDNARNSYLNKWNSSINALFAGLKKLDSTGSNLESLDQSLRWNEAAKTYQSHFLSIVKRIENGQITSANEANLAMATVKDSVRYLSNSADSFSISMSQKQADSGKQLSASVRNNMFTTILLTIFPSAMILIWSVRFTNQIVVRTDQLVEYSDELKLQSEILKKAEEESTRANLAKSEFLANMSHELRTPMNSIIGFTKRLLTKLEGQLDERNLDALQTVDRNARHLLGLINDVLDISKIEAGRMELHRSQFDMVEAIREVVSRSDALIDDRPIELITELPDALIEVDADRIKIVQVITNLLSNGIKYTDEGTVTLKVATHQEARLGSVVKVSITDTGRGIKEEDLNRLFTKFTQLDGSLSRPVGGTGLGLYITSQFVEMHGGRIEVDSEFKIGSTFTVTLPVHAVTPIQPAKTTPKTVPTDKLKLGGVRSYCDDDPLRR